MDVSYAARMCGANKAHKYSYPSDASNGYDYLDDYYRLTRRPTQTTLGDYYDA